MKKNQLSKLFLSEPGAIADLFSVIYKDIKFGDGSRYFKKTSENDFWKAVSLYNSIPEESVTDKTKVVNIISTFLTGAVNWKSKKLLYNVGAPVSTYALIANAIALDTNVYNINDGLSGNMLAAERAVVESLGNLAGLDTKKIAGLFTFGGTATNLYAMKIGLSKALPDTRTKGIFNKKIKFFITEDAHFSHLRSADWLGIGSDNVEIIKPDFLSRKSLITDAEFKITKAIEAGFTVPTIIINGGTTYSHTIDNIKGFVEMRDRIFETYKLSYKPHIHVDSVIGWAWLVFKEYDFQINQLSIDSAIIDALKRQTTSIAEIKLADSWGIDFHKGVGACPIDSSLIMINQSDDLNYISRKLDPSIKTHQLATDFSFSSPVDYTLETSRSGGSSLSALMMLQTSGLNGIRIHLSNLVSAVNALSKLFKEDSDTMVMNYENNNYVLMLRLYPPNRSKDDFNIEIEDTGDKIKERIRKNNEYNKSFFSFDLATRISLNNDFEYSFSAEYLQSKSGSNLSALKFYPTSPSFSVDDVRHIYETIRSQKKKFDNTISHE